MGPEGIILVNPPITTFQQSLTHSAMLWSDRLMQSWLVKSHQNHAAFVKKLWFSSTMSTFSCIGQWTHINIIKYAKLH